MTVRKIVKDLYGKDLFIEKEVFPAKKENNWPDWKISKPFIGYYENPREFH